MHHPNILALYGYSLNVNHTQQYLVYEHPAQGPLDGFLHEDWKSTQLTALIRLSIMHDLTTAVHSLHTDHYKDGRRFHRDIQSANIWLSDDYTAQLMDCGLAKFVPFISNASTTSSVVTALSPFGTRGYMCPEYLNNADLGHYEAAYDVYSVGVVMVELILGYSIGGPSSSHRTRTFCVFRDCFEDDEGNQIMNGFELLKAHADRSIIWTSESLDLVCKAAIRCLTPISIGRMNTTELLDMTRQAMRLHAPIKFDNHIVSQYEFSKCEICQTQQDLKRCHRGHAVCRMCIETKIFRYMSRPDQFLGVCPARRCPSHDDYLYGYLPPEVIERYLRIEFDFDRTH